MSINISGSKSITGIEQVKAKLNGYSRRINNPAPVFKTIGSYFSAHNRKMFATNGLSGGKAWRPLKPDYLQWKIRTGKSPRTLVSTGKLRASYVSRPMGVEKYGKRTAHYGSNVNYAHYHQSGTRHMPARRVMNVTKKIKHDIKEIVDDYVSGSKTSVRKLL